MTYALVRLVWFGSVAASGLLVYSVLVDVFVGR
jgi:hypothetical protein